jgi:hypothetical protein
VQTLSLLSPSPRLEDSPKAGVARQKRSHPSIAAKRPSKSELFEKQKSRRPQAAGVGFY